MEDVLPMDDPLNAFTIRSHVLDVAERLEKELGEEQHCSIEGCQRDWSTPRGSSAYSGRAMAISTRAKSAKMRQSCASLASAKVERVIRPRKPMWYNLPRIEPKQTSMSRRLSR
jgi:hypothetical protein